ncbi:LptF/LptG family permease [Sungkyunkwania multivorans]|uniref:LptF/LptG family permease n=1 Tax=Sungkyunkwania multivorans TaxID=1173618 RepID=A0ABW3CTY7_9FLAO
MKILDWYILKRYLQTFFVMLLLFVPIAIMVHVSEKIDKFKDNDVPLDAILPFYLDYTIYIGFLLFSIFLFISVIWFTSKLANNTEVIAMLSSGISFYRYLRPYMIGATIIAFIALVGGMFVLPAASKGYNEFNFKYFKGGLQKAQQTSALYKQVNDNDYIYVSSYDPAKKMAYNFSYEHFDGNRLVYKINARNIRWIEEDTLYRLSGYKKRVIEETNDSIQEMRRVDAKFPFNIEDLSVVNYMAETLNYNELNDFIEKERQSGSSLVNNHLLVKYKRISLPVSVFILTIIAVAVASFKRRGGMGVNLAFGILIAFTFVFFDKIFGVMAQKSDFSPMLAAWLPNIVFGIFAVYLLNNAKR